MTVSVSVGVDTTDSVQVETIGWFLSCTTGNIHEIMSGQIAFGGLPEVVPRGPGGTRRPAARKVDGAVGGLFKSGALDRLLK